MIKEMGVEIILVEVIDTAKKMDFFHAIDCLFIPSFFMEPGPIVLLEAILCGKKVVASDISGPLDFANKFPGEVINYDWNKAGSAISQLQALHYEEQKNQEDQKERLKIREEKFINDQIKVYVKAINR